MTRAMRKKYIPVEDSAGRLRLKAGGRDIILLCDVIDELEGLLRDIQQYSPVNVQNTIERKLLAMRTRNVKA